MRDSCLWIVDVTEAFCDGCQTEVDVFVAVPVAGVETSEVGEELSADGETGAGDGVNVGECFSPVCVEVPCFESWWAGEVDCYSG